VHATRSSAKAALFDHLRQCWQELFQARFDVLLYDLTSTYIEGEGEEIPKANQRQGGGDATEHQLLRHQF
jgi:hypothetical protein